MNINQDRHTAHNTANTDIPFVEKDYSDRSMPFGAREN